MGAVVTRLNLLNAVAAADTVSDAVEVTGTTQYTVEAVTTGSPSSIEVQLQKSINGTLWVTFGSLQSQGHLAVTLEQPVKYIRLRLSTLSGGSSPTVSASLAAR